MLLFRAVYILCFSELFRYMKTSMHSIISKKNGVTRSLELLSERARLGNFSRLIERMGYRKEYLKGL